MAADRPRRILVVDDHPDALYVLSDALRRLGYAVEIATGGREALRRFAEERPATVILDLQLPGMDGMAVFAEMHRIARDVPVIIVTASRDKAQARGLLRSGVFDYLTKPVDLGHLAAAVAAATGQACVVRSQADGRTAPTVSAPTLSQIAYAVMAVARRLEGPDPVRQQLEDLAHEALLARPRAALERLIEIRRLFTSGALARLHAADIVALRRALAPFEAYVPHLDSEAMARSA